jgi:putative ABC transport system permease protein
MQGAGLVSLDVRICLRGLWRHPTYLLGSVLTLALGIGAVIAMFSVVYSVLIRPLPYEDPEQLVQVRYKATRLGNEILASSTMYLTYRDQNRSFEQFGLWQQASQSLTGNGDPEQLRALLVTEGTLQALGVQPIRGRWFSAAEHKAGALDAEPVILTHRLWQRRFGSDESALGLQFELDSSRVRVVGIMPPTFRFLDMEPQPEVIRAIRLDPATQSIGAFSSQLIGRLKPGVTPEEAAADIQRTLPIWLARWPISSGSRLTREDIENWRIAAAAIPLKEDLTRGIAPTLWLFMTTIGFVLLISCANVANLMILRATARRAEFAVRAALGAAPAEIGRFVMIEGIAIGLLGGALGLAFARLCLAVVVAFGPVDLPRLDEVALHPPVVVFGVAAALLSVLVFASIAAFKSAASSKLSTPTNMSSSRSTPDDSRVRNALVVAQVALVVALLVSAALMGRSLQTMLAVETGFSAPETLQTARASISPSVIADVNAFTTAQREILERVAAIPGVSSAAIASAVPMDGRFNAGPLAVDGPASPIDESTYSNRFKWVSPAYFATMGTRIVAGRDMTWADVEAGGRVAVISERLARQLAVDPADAIGQRIRVPIEQDAWREVVGVAEDVYEDGLYAEPPSTVYWPMRMDGFFNSSSFGQRDIAYVLRTSRAGQAALLDEVRERVWSVNGNIPVFGERTMHDLYGDSLGRASFATVMLGIASGLALALGIVGIYGVMAHVVSRRTREIGIRSALGAEPQQLRRMFVLHGLRICGTGMVIGLVLSAALGGLLSSLLFGVAATDPVAYMMAIGVALAATTLASYLPARRAASLDPSEVLRAE